MKKVSFVIPCYRSEHTLPHVVKEIREKMQELTQYEYDIFLVNDASPDNTMGTIRDLCDKYDNIKGIGFARNFGQHAALMAGLRHSDGDYVVCLDDDGQTPADEVDKLLGKLEEGFDAVYARYEHKQHSAFRNMGSKVNELMTRMMLDKPADLYISSYFAVKKFYRELYPMADEPLFWIHLNVDYPFNLTGILYFPKVKSNIELQKNKIQLYCNQVYVTDSVEGIVPDFLTLLHGVIDSPDIPLNVSRSYLQSDSNVKKISTYISKKVSDRLQAIFKNDCKEFEEKWDDLKIFINYGMLTQEDFYEKANKFALLKDTDDKYYTYEEYQSLIKDNQTDKDGNLIYLYATHADEQYSYIDAAKNKGYNVLLMDGQLDVAMVSMLEQKFEKSRFTRVDSDVIDHLIC